MRCHVARAPGSGRSAADEAGHQKGLGRMERLKRRCAGGSLTSESGRRKAASSQPPAGRLGKAAGGPLRGSAGPVWVPADRLNPRGVRWEWPCGNDTQGVPSSLTPVPSAGFRVPGAIEPATRDLRRGATEKGESQGILVQFTRNPQLETRNRIFGGGRLEIEVKRARAQGGCLGSGKR